MARLTDKQKLFIASYLANGLNGTEAAAQAGYKGNRATLASIASENLRKPKIREVIDEHLKAHTMSAQEVLYRLTEQARATLADFIDPNTDDVSTAQAAERGKLHLAKEITHTVTEKGDDVLTRRVTVKLHDAQAALVHLGRAHNLFRADEDDRGDVHVHVHADDLVRQRAQDDAQTYEEQLLSGDGDPDDDSPASDSA